MTSEPTSRRAVIHGSSLGALLVWGFLAAATVFALWPALWVSPLRAYHQVQLGIAAEDAEPHMLGNYFLGRPPWLLLP